MSGFQKGMCNCPHAPKHHKRSGRCRGTCQCRAAQFKVGWKRMARRPRLTNQPARLGGRP